MSVPQNPITIAESQEYYGRFGINYTDSYWVSTHTTIIACMGDMQVYT